MRVVQTRASHAISTCTYGGVASHPGCAVRVARLVDVHAAHDDHDTSSRIVHHDDDGVGVLFWFRTLVDLPSLQGCFLAASDTMCALLCVCSCIDVLFACVESIACSVQSVFVSVSARCTEYDTPHSVVPTTSILKRAHARTTSDNSTSQERHA